MTSILDIGEGGIDPQTEVKKLQDLVKKLETQNEVLRQKQKLTPNENEHVVGKSDCEVLKPAVNNSVFYNTRKQLGKRDVATLSQCENLETIDILDVNNSVSEDDDSWLYSSPRPLTTQQTRVSPYKWVRQDFDHPSPDVQTTRKCLKYKLDEAARMSRSSSSPALQNFSMTHESGGPAMSLSADSTPSPRVMKPAIKPPLAYNPSLQGSRINTGTFTRPKKAKEKPSPEEPNEVYPASTEPATHHPNVADIENLAKMQEESLRQSIAQTSPRRGFRSRPLPNMSASQTLDSTSQSSHDSTGSSPVCGDDDVGRLHSNNSVGSDTSSPPDSPRATNLPNHTGTSSLRGSVPNMSRLVPRAQAAQHYNSDSSLAADTQQLSIDDYQEEQSPQRYVSRMPQNNRSASPSMSGLRQPGVRGASPQRSGLPSPRRSIPRPGSATTPRSGLAQPKRISGLPAPGSMARNSQQRPRLDNSWKEGCF